MLSPHDEEGSHVEETEDLLIISKSSINSVPLRTYEGKTSFATLIWCACLAAAALLIAHVLKVDGGPANVSLIGTATSSSNRNTPNHRVITVFGLEASGTTFLYETLSTALNTTPDIHGMTSIGDRVEVQHISQPWGSTGNSTDGYITVEVVPPPGCADYYRVRPSNNTLNCPLRFFVNVTSHVESYRNQGIDCTAVISIRDYTAHLEGKKRHISPGSSIHWREVAKAEDAYGTKLLVDAIESLHHSVSPNGYPELILVSYEMLMYLREEYLMELYEKLGLVGDNIYVPSFRDANSKYFRDDDSSNVQDSTNTTVKGSRGKERRSLSLELENQ
mmetsp:Transcript_27379/g.60011  ORF Transcript_27379/g.60011 Transcript_27379/m.60011 type:complete len:333 (-) Transcript_27379:443-1441(-)